MTERTPLPSHFERHVIVKTDEHGHQKKRDILDPDQETRDAHASMLKYFYDFGFLDTTDLPNNFFVSAGMPETNILQNILPHRDNMTFYKLDFTNAFPSVNLDILKEKLVARAIELGRGSAVQSYMHTFIDEFVATPEVTGLPLGAPASPYLFNFYLHEMDAVLSAFCEAKNLTYTRWFDDVTVSSPKKDDTLGKDTRREIRAIMEEKSGIRINPLKTHLHRRIDKPVTITGVSIYPDRHIQARPQIIKNALDVFNAVADEVYDVSSIITPSHLGLVDGHHGALVSMSVEPYQKPIKRALAEYRVTSHLVRAAMAMQEEAPHVPDPAREVFVKEMIRDMNATAYRKAHGMSYIQDGKRVLNDEEIVS
jgi:hypothetical protein